MDRSASVAFIVVLGAVGLFVGLFLGPGLGPGDLHGLFAGTDPLLTGIFVLRLGRTLLGLVVGAALGLAGAALQGLTRNPLADPFLTGGGAGAASSSPSPAGWAPRSGSGDWQGGRGGRARGSSWPAW